MYEHFTDRARKVMQLANQEAMRFNHEYIGTEHILLGLIKEGSGVAAMVLKELGIDLRTIRLEVDKMVQSGPDVLNMGSLPKTPRAKRVIDYAMEECRNFNHHYVGTEHLLLGLIREGEGVAAKVLMVLGLGLDAVRDAVRQALGFCDDRDAQVTDSGSTFRIRIELCRALLRFDESIDLLDRAVFEAAHYSGVGNLDAQRDRATSNDFQPPVKRQRDEVMGMRNTLAQMLGFAARLAHSFAPRDYEATSTGYLVRKNQ